VGATNVLFKYFTWNMKGSAAPELMEDEHPTVEQKKMLPEAPEQLIIHVSGFIYFISVNFFLCNSGNYLLLVCIFISAKISTIHHLAHTHTHTHKI